MRWLVLLAVLCASPALAQSLRTPDQRPFHIAVIPPTAPVLGSSTGRQLVATPLQGSATVDTKAQMAAGSTVTGHVPQYDATGGLVDSGGGPAASSFLNAASAASAYSLYGSL